MLARPMRGVAVFVTLLVLVAAVLTLQGLGAFTSDAPPEDPSHPAAAPMPSAAAKSDGAFGPGLVATRTAAAPSSNPNLADAPTACLHVVDRSTNRPVPGAPIRRVQGGNEIAFTDERGLAAVALREPEQLAVVVAGYLLRLVPTRPGTTEAEPQEVQLVRDEWSIVRRLQFVTADGQTVPEAFVRFRPRTSTKATPSPVPAGDAVAQRAWDEHTRLATLAVFGDVPVQLGTWAEDRVHRLASGTDVRFIAASDYSLEVATTTGLVARHEVRVETSPRIDAPPIRVPLAPGAFIDGTVVDLAGARAIADATITLQGGEPLGLVATTAGDGTFRFGPLFPERATLLVRHGDHEPLAFGPVAVPAGAVRIALQALPATMLRGRVRSRPDLRPLAGATVSWMPAGSAPVAATTDAEGHFALRATGSIDARLAVQAPGHLAYAELVAPGSPFADYDLWPATTQERLAHGLSAVLEGIVVDNEGRPLAGVDVRWQPQQRPAPPGVPVRRILEGGAIELALGARTGPDGAFQLETNAFGAGRLVVATDPKGPGVDVVAIAGQTKNGLRLQP